MIRITALVVGACLFGCQSYPWTYRPDQRVSVTKVREIVFQDSNTDILFVVDTSGSMPEEQGALIANLAAFIAVLAQSENQYRVGVVTMDAYEYQSNQGGQLKLFPAPQTDLDNAGCSITPSSGTPPYLERPPLTDPPATLAAKRCRLEQDFIRTIITIGTGGSGTEAGLLAAMRALDPNDTNTNTVNAGFMREDADLALIFLTDEEDCTFVDRIGANRPSGLQCYTEYDQQTPTEDLVDFFANLKSNYGGVRKVRAAAIVAGKRETTEGAPFVPSGCHRPTGESLSRTDCECWDSIPGEDAYCAHLMRFGHTCGSSASCPGTFRCDALAGSRYVGFLADLRQERNLVGFSPGVVADSICNEDYKGTLESIARNVVLSDCFTLEEPALSPEGVKLFLGEEGDSGAVERELPRYSATDPTADCNDCNNCSDGAWEYQDDQTMCLACGIRKQPGQLFSLVVLNELIDPTAGGD